jgi:hypothetical protein
MERLGVLNSRIGQRGEHVFEPGEVERVAEHVERTGRALPNGDAPDPDTVAEDAVAALRTQVRQAAGQVAARRERIRLTHLESARFRGLLVDALDKVVAATRPRDRAAVDALERLLQLVADSMPEADGT